MPQVLNGELISCGSYSNNWTLGSSSSQCKLLTTAWRLEFTLPCPSFQSLLFPPLLCLPTPGSTDLLSGRDPNSLLLAVHHTGMQFPCLLANYSSF